MFEKLAYLALKNRLITGNPLGLQVVDWYTNNARNSDNGQDFMCPAVLIEFLPITWQMMPERIQQAVVNFRTYLVQDRNVDLRSDDAAVDTNITYLDLAQALHLRLQAYGYSYTSGSNTFQLFNDVSRISNQVDHTPGQRNVTITTWKALAYDFSANLAYQKQSIAPAIEAELVIPFKP